MRYLVKMSAVFALGMFLVVKSSHFAADGKPVSACLLGLFVFAVFVYIANESAKEERRAKSRERGATISGSAGEAVVTESEDEK